MPGYTIDDLKTLMSRLREPGYGCPWDLEQSYQTIAPSTLEEAYEVVDAIEQGDLKQLKEELGDLLFQVIFYSQLGKEEGAFDFDEIASAITEKLLRRHPHVFPEGTLQSRIDLNEVGSERRQEAINASWEQIKQEEREAKGQCGILDDVPKALPALPRAAKLQKRAARVGFDWPDSSGVYNKLQEELAELKEAEQSRDTAHIEEELGDVLFTAVNLARQLKLDPETALRRANQKFEQRFRFMEAQAEKQKAPLSEDKHHSLEALEALWQQAKQHS